MLVASRVCRFFPGSSQMCSQWKHRNVCVPNRSNVSTSFGDSQRGQTCGAALGVENIGSTYLRSACACGLFQRLLPEGRNVRKASSGYHAESDEMLQVCTATLVSAKNRSGEAVCRPRRFQSVWVHQNVSRARCLLLHITANTRPVTLTGGPVSISRVSRRTPRTRIFAK